MQAPLPWHMVKDDGGFVPIGKVQSELPVSVQVPVILFPVSVPVRVKVFPEGDPDATVNESGPVTTLSAPVVAVRVPLADAPDTKHGPAVMNSIPVTFNELSPLTVNVVIKLRPEASPLPPDNTACQVPLAVVAAVVVELPPPQLATVNPSARSANTATSLFMFTLKLD